MKLTSKRIGRHPRLALVIALLGWPLATPAGPAVAAEGAPRPGLPGVGGAAGKTGEVPAPGKAGAGPSQSETGTVGSVDLAGQAATKTLRAGPKQESRPEKAVTPSRAGADPGARPAPAPQAAPPRLVQEQVTVRLRRLGDCRRDVAHDKHVPAAQVTAGALLLRWTIDVEGTVSATEVVAQTSVDPALMECVKRAVSSWTFPPPDHGPLKIERRYQFRALK